MTAAHANRSNPKRRVTRNAGVSYGDHRLTGAQDCGNTFSPDEFDFESGGTAEEIVDRELDSWDSKDWLDQCDEDVLDGLDPEKAFQAWLDGYRSCAIRAVEHALTERMDRAEMFYLAETDAAGEPVDFVERFDDLEDAESALKKMKRGRGAIYEGDLHGPTYRITPGGPTNRSVQRTMWRNPPFQHAGDKPEAEVLRQFRELLADRDPGSLTIAEDLLLEHGLKLTDIGEALAKEGLDNNRGTTSGWANDFPSAGEFVVSKTQDPDITEYSTGKYAGSDTFAAVAWMVWKARSVAAVAWMVWKARSVKSTFRVEVVISYQSMTWSETMSGPEGGGVRGYGSRVRTRMTSFTEAEKQYLDSLPSLILQQPKSLKAARTLACDLAWRIAKELKRYPDLDPLVFIGEIHEREGLLQVGAPVDWRARKGHKPKYGTPRALINPRDNASGNWEVRSDSGLEGIFAREEDANDYADELKRGVGARGLKVQRRRPLPSSRSSSEANPTSFTPKGERMYQHVRQSYAGSPRAKEIAARTVSARAAEGAPGLVKNAKQPTFADARLNIIYLLEDRGWSVSKALKIPHATSPDGSLRLWFKPQAVWYTSLGEQGDREGLGSSGYHHGGGKRHDYGDARSLWFDIRSVSNEQFLAKIQRRFPSALAAFP